MTRFLKILAISLAFSGFVSAQLTNVVEGGVTQNVETVWDIPSEDITVGGNSSSNRMFIFNGGRVTNQNTYIGTSTNGNDNIIAASGDAEWDMSGELVIGDRGTGNYFEINGGASVANADAFVGKDASSTGNIAYVTGGDWNVDGTLTIWGLSNSVAVDNGGLIAAKDLVISTNGSGFYLNDGGTFSIDNDFNAGMTGFVWNTGGHLELTGDLSGMQVTNNAVYLSNSRDLTLNGGSWTNENNDLIVGYEGSGSELSITNKAVVENQDGFIGWSANSANNKVIVSDTDSEWRNNGNLYLGTYGNPTNLQAAGTGNGLTVTNGGVVFVGEAGTNDVAGTFTGGIIVGSTNGAVLIADNGSSIVTDGTLYLGGADTNITGSATITNGSTLVTDGLEFGNNGSFLNLDKGGKLQVTGDLDVDGSSGLIWNDDTELEVNGELTLDGGLTGENRTLTVSGSDAGWTLDDTIVSGENNTVEIEGGAGVTNLAGGTVAGENNQVIVKDSGTHWLNQGELKSIGTNNNVTVSDNGKITAGSIDFTGNNTFNLNDGGTLAITSNFNWSAVSNFNWSADGNLEIQGDLTGIETASVSAEGTNKTATILNNERSVTINGGSWSDIATNDLIIGYNSSGASVAFTNKALVKNQDGYIGWGSDSTGNRVLVSDENTIWHNEGGDLYLGAYYTGGTNLAKAGFGNTLIVRDGAKVFVGEATNNVAGMLVASTNGANFTIWGGQAFIDDTLTIGVDTNTTGDVTVKSGGDLSVEDLVIADGSLLDLQEGGIFRIATNFNQHAFEGNGFDWVNTNTTVEVGGILTRTNFYLDKEQNLILNGSNATWAASASETLEIGHDGNSIFTLRNGAALSNRDTIIGASTNAGSSGMIVESGSIWTTTGQLEIGSSTAENFLQVLSGATVNIGTSVYLGTNGTDNVIQVSGSNSVLFVSNDLLVGGASADSTGNTVSLGSQGRLIVNGDVAVFDGNSMVFSGATNVVGGDFTLQSNAVLSGTGKIELSTGDAVLRLMDGNGYILDDSQILIEGDGTADLDVHGGGFYLAGSNTNYYEGFDTLNLTDTILLGSGTNDVFSMVNMEGGIIEPFNLLTGNPLAELVISGDFVATSNVTYNAQVYGDIGVDHLWFTGATGVDLTNMAAAVLVAQAPSNLTATILTADNGIANNFSSINISNRLLLFDAELVITNANTTVDLVLTENNDKFSSALDYAATESVRAGFNGMKNAVFTRTKQLRRNLVSTAHSMPHDAFLMTNTNSPVGPDGPGADNTIFDMHVWAQYFGGQGDFSSNGDSYGYSLNNNGTTFGADRLFGEDLTLGFNYTYTRGEARTTNDDFLENETYWLGAYGEWVNTGGLYVDALAAYGRSNNDSVRVVDDADRTYRGAASYRGSNFGGYVDVGQYMYYKNLSIAPYLGLHMLFINTDEHIETEEEGSQIKVSSQSRNIVESALGLKGRHRFDTGIGRFQTTGYAEWTHDFVQDEITTELQAIGVEGVNTRPVSMAAIKPGEDLFNVGLGLSWRSTEYMEIGVGYNGRFNDEYEEHSGTLMLDIMF